MAVVENRWWWRADGGGERMVLGYMGWWNEHLVLLEDFWEDSVTLDIILCLPKGVTANWVCSE
jgi:hypothetical protein